MGEQPCESIIYLKINIHLTTRIQTIGKLNPKSKGNIDFYFGCGEIYNMKSNKEVMEYPYPFTMLYFIIGNLPIIILRARVYLIRFVNVEIKVK